MKISRIVKIFSAKNSLTVTLIQKIEFYTVTLIQKNANYTITLKQNIYLCLEKQ